MSKMNGDACNREGCRGHLHDHELGYRLYPHPLRALKCDTCEHVWFLVRQPGRPDAEGWLIDQGQDEGFDKYVERIRRGEGGPQGGHSI